MKTISQFCFALLCFVLLFPSCELDCTKGSGDVISETRIVDFFDKIELRGSFDLHLSQSNSSDNFSLIIEADDNILPLVETRINSQDRLIVDLEDCIRSQEPIVLFVSVPNIEEIAIKGSSDVFAATTWDFNSLKLEIDGSGDVDVDSLFSNFVEIDIEGSGDVFMKHIDALTINAEVRGSGNIDLAGFANNFNVEIDGSGDVDALDLIAETCDIDISGSGDCEVTATDELNIKIRGSGSVLYRGDPVISSSISGSGEIIKLD
ncbi:MAG: head GIN domain-containing protein [Chitinophagales bacterium]